MHALFVRCEHLLGGNLLFSRQARRDTLVHLKHALTLRVILQTRLYLFKFNEVALFWRQHATIFLVLVDLYLERELRLRIRLRLSAMLRRQWTCCYRVSGMVFLNLPRRIVFQSRPIPRVHFLVIVWIVLVNLNWLLFFIGSRDIGPALHAVDFKGVTHRALRAPFDRVVAHRVKRGERLVRGLRDLSRRTCPHAMIAGDMLCQTRLRQGRCSWVAGLRAHGLVELAQAHFAIKGIATATLSARCDNNGVLLLRRVSFLLIYAC